MIEGGGDMTLTHDKFKVACALVDIAGVPERTGMSPAQCVNALCELENEAETMQQLRADLAAAQADADLQRRAVAVLADAHNKAMSRLAEEGSETACSCCPGLPNCKGGCRCPEAMTEYATQQARAQIEGGGE